MHTRRHILINWQAPTQGPASFTSRVIIKRLRMLGQVSVIALEVRRSYGAHFLVNLSNSALMMGASKRQK